MEWLLQNFDPSQYVTGVLIALTSFAAGIFGVAGLKKLTGVWSAVRTLGKWPITIVLLAVIAINPWLLLAVKSIQQVPSNPERVSVDDGKNQKGGDADVESLAEAGPQESDDDGVASRHLSMKPFWPYLHWTLEEDVKHHKFGGAGLVDFGNGLFQCNSCKDYLKLVDGRLFKVSEKAPQPPKR